MITTRTSGIAASGTASDVIKQLFGELTGGAGSSEGPHDEKH